MGVGATLLGAGVLMEGTVVGANDGLSVVGFAVGSFVGMLVLGGAVAWEGMMVVGMYAGTFVGLVVEMVG
jgi:hypothetical protein